jgi:hypothetical protein
VSSSTDPVRTILDILQAASDSKWSTIIGAPDYLERMEETEFSTKTNRTGGPAVYVWSPAEGPFEQMGASYGAYFDDQVVQTDVWSVDSAARAAGLAGDVRDIVFDFATDNQQSTEWSEIAPDSENDLRAETAVRRADHYVVQVQVGLHAYREL